MKKLLGFILILFAVHSMARDYTDYTHLWVVRVTYTNADIDTIICHYHSTEREFNKHGNCNLFLRESCLVTEIGNGFVTECCGVRQFLIIRRVTLPFGEVQYHRLFDKPFEKYRKLDYRK